MSHPPSHIVVVGAGIIGVTTAYYLAHHPSFDPSRTTITILDGTAVAAGASGKAGGLLALDWHGPATSSLAALSYRLHATLAARYDGADVWGYRRLDTLSVQTNSRGARRKAKVPGEIDWLNNDTVEKVGVLGTTETTAQVHPRKFCHFLLSEAESKGVKYVHGKVNSIDSHTVRYLPHSDHPTADASAEEKTIESDCIIVAAGPWTSTLLPEIPISGTRAHSITIKTTHPVTPHALFTSMTLKSGTHVEPELYARSDEIYVCGEGDTDDPLPESADAVTVIPSRCDILKSFADELSSTLKNGTIGVKQACYLPSVDSRSGAPVVGKVRDGVYVASGHSCWGICLGPGTGLVVSELIMDGKVKSADISMLDPVNVR